MKNIKVDSGSWVIFIVSSILGGIFFAILLSFFSLNAYIWVTAWLILTFGTSAMFFLKLDQRLAWRIILVVFISLLVWMAGMALELSNCLFRPQCFPYEIIAWVASGLVLLVGILIAVGKNIESKRKPK